MPPKTHILPSNTVAPMARLADHIGATVVTGVQEVPLVEVHTSLKCVPMWLRPPINHRALLNTSTVCVSRTSQGAGVVAVSLVQAAPSGEDQTSLRRPVEAPVSLPPNPHSFPSNAATAWCARAVHFVVVAVTSVQFTPSLDFHTSSLTVVAAVLVLPPSNQSSPL